MAFGTLSLKGRALRLLSQREHSRRELESKLSRHAQDSPEQSGVAHIAAVLDELAAHGLLSDERTAASVLNSSRQRFGIYKIKQTLQAKGLAPELIAVTVAQAQGGEAEAAREVWQRRFGSPPANPRERARQHRFLAGRGFSAGAISQLLSRVDDPDSD